MVSHLNIFFHAAALASVSAGAQAGTAPVAIPDPVAALPTPSEYLAAKKIAYGAETMRWVAALGGQVRIVESGSPAYTALCLAKPHKCAQIWMNPVQYAFLRPTGEELSLGEDFSLIVVSPPTQASFDRHFEWVFQRRNENPRFTPLHHFTFSLFHELQHYESYRLGHATPVTDAQKHESEQRADARAHQVMKREFGDSNAAMIPSYRALGFTDAVHDSSVVLTTSTALSYKETAASAAALHRQAEICDYRESRASAEFAARPAVTRLYACLKDSPVTGDPGAESMRQRYLQAYRLFFAPAP